MAFNKFEHFDENEVNLVFTKEELDDFQSQNQKPYSFINNLIELNDENTTLNQYDSRSFNFEMFLSRESENEN